MHLNTYAKIGKKAGKVLNMRKYLTKVESRHDLTNHANSSTSAQTGKKTFPVWVNEKKTE
jgi:hypothetical protein